VLASAHQGYIYQDILSAYFIAQNQERDVKKSELESLFINYLKQEYLAFYYFMLDLLTKYLHEKFNYSGSYKPNLQTLETNNSIL